MRFNPTSFRYLMETSILVVLFIVINNSRSPQWVYTTFVLAFIIVGFQLFQAIRYRLGHVNFFLLPGTSDSLHRFITFFTGGFMVCASIVSFFLPIQFVHHYGFLFLILGCLIVLNGFFKNAYRKLQIFEKEIYIDDITQSIPIRDLQRIWICTNELIFIRTNQQQFVIKKLDFSETEKEKLRSFFTKHSLFEGIAIDTK